jgi:hypothetical protein
MQLNTVNVIELIDGVVRAVYAYTDDGRGNKEAEMMFKQIGRDNGYADQEIDAAMDDGYLGSET